MDSSPLLENVFSIIFNSWKINEAQIWNKTYFIWLSNVLGFMVHTLN